MKNTKDFKREFLEIIKLVNKPSRYSGGEWNSIVKNPLTVQLKVALLYPELYEIGMSNMGLHILYHKINSIKDISAERFFTPQEDLAIELKKGGIPLLSIENKIPLNNFDIIGISLLSELNFTNIPFTLQLGGVKRYADKREEESPIVIGGGISAFNPEPVWRYFDLFYFGDGETVFIEALKQLLKMKKEKTKRSEILEELSKMRGFFSPLSHKREKKGKFYVIDNLKIKKAVLSNINKYPFPENIIVPNTEIVFDRFSFEIARGCPQRCRFCQATFVYHPFRWRDPSLLLTQIKKAIEKTGFEELSLSSLSTVDYPYIEELLESLLPLSVEKKVSIGLPSLRPKKITEAILNSIQSVRKRGFTIVPEAGSEKLRKIINKDVSDEDVFKSLEYAYKFGWKNIKFYFMIGLPQEDEDDIKSIGRLLIESYKFGKKFKLMPKITASIAVFVPKAHTPFQWERFIKEKEYIDKKKLLISQIKRFKNIRVRFHDYFPSLIEAVSSRGDIRIFNVIDKAEKEGAIFTGWKKNEDKEVWEKAFYDEEITIETFTDEIETSQKLPWDFIDTGVKKEYLLNEYLKSKEAKTTASCFKAECSLCKGCISPVKKIKKIELESNLFEQIKNTSDLDGNRNSLRYIIFYEKSFPSSLLSPMDISKTVERIMRRANFPFKISEGFHPKPKFSFPPADPTGIEAEEDVFEIITKKEIGQTEIENLNRFTIDGLKFKGYLKTEKKLSHLIKGITYKLELTNKDISEININKKHILIKKEKAYMLITIKYNKDKNISPFKEIKKEFPLLLIKSIKRVKVVLKES